MITDRSLTVSRGLAALLAAACMTGCILETEVGYTGSGGGAGADGGQGGAATVGGAGGSGATGAGATGGSGGGGTTGGSGGTGATGGSGGGGAAGVPELLVAATFDMNPWGIAIDATNVYFTDAMGINGKVSRVPKAGGPLTVLASGLELPGAVAVDATDVYVLTFDHLLRVPIAGGVFTNIGTGGAGYARIVLDNDTIYWTDGTLGGALRRMAKGGGGIMHIDDGHDTEGLVLHDGTLYWSSIESGAIKSAPSTGGTVSVFASGQDYPRMGLITDGADLYWMNEGTFPMQLWKGPLDGSAPPAQIGVAPSDSSWAVTFAVDSTYLYYPIPYCEIARMPLAGGPTEVFQVDPLLGCPRFIVGEADNLYYTSDAGVTRYPKSALQ